MGSDISIVLSPIFSESTQLVSKRHYDPTVRFIRKNVGENQRLPEFSVHRIIAEFNKEHGSVHQITLPVQIFTKTRTIPRESTTIHPGVWETRSVRGNTGWAVIFGTRTGQRMGSNSILQVRYPTQKEATFQNGRRALLTCSEGILMTFVNVEEYKETYFTYRVDNILDWPKACTIYQPPEHDCKVGSANMTLMCVFIKDQFNPSKGWVNDELLPDQLDGIKTMQTAAREAVLHADVSPRFLENIVSATHSSRSQLVHSVPEDGDLEVRVMKTAPEDFASTMYHELDKYRRALLLADHKHKNRLVPMNAAYQVVEHNDKGQMTLNVMITLEVPSILDNYPNFAIEAEFSTITEDLAAEPSLTYAATNFYDFVNFVIQDGGVKNLLSRV